MTQGVPDVYDAIPRAFNAAAWFVDRRLEQHDGHRVAILCEGDAYTYADVAAGVNRVGNALRALGVEMEQRVVLILRDTPAFVYAFWGAIKIGAVPVPVNTLLTAHDLAYILDDTRAPVAIVDAAHADTVCALRTDALHLRHVLVAGGTAPDGARALDAVMAGAPVTLAPAPTTRDDDAFWLYSSGTTGTPKGVVHLHHDMVVCVEGFGRHVLEIGPDDRCFSVAKLFFAYGLGNALYFPFSAGATSVLLPARPEPARVFETIAATRPTLFFAVPTAFAALLQEAARHPELAMPSVRRCLSAGEPLPRALYERWLARFGVEILDGIGSTELCHTFIANRAGRVKPGSSGEIVPGYAARIVDDDGCDVPDGETGHLLVSGESACACYWNQHRRSRATIVGDWVRTGDKYTRDADGYYWYHGRADDMIKAGGIWVSPAEVEAVLIEHTAVVEAGVVGAEDADELVKPLAFVVLADGWHGSEMLERELREFVKQRLAPFKCPRWVRFVPALPKTATGKIQRYRLREEGGRPSR